MHKGGIASENHQTMEEFSHCNHHNRLSYSQKGKAVARSDGFPDPTLNLTDEILSLIATFLPMREAVRTSTLSKRWRNIWKGRSIINFDVDEIVGKVIPEDEPSTSYPYDEFIRLVDCYFDEQESCGIKTFCLHIRSKHHYGHLNRWLNMANEMKVEKVHLNLSGCGFRYDDRLVLKIQGVMMKHFSVSNCHMSFNPPHNRFNSVTSIEFENVVISDNFILCYPKLERLTLLNCKGLTNLITSCKLKYARVVNSVVFLEINAKYLTHFECSGFPEAAVLAIQEDGDSCDYERMCFPYSKHDPGKCVYTPHRRLGGFKSLKVLSLLDATFPRNHLSYLLSNSSFVEDLTLEGCLFESNELDISGLHQLRSLNISKCPGITKVIVCATNLKKFAFVARSSPLCQRESFMLINCVGNDCSSVIGKGSFQKLMHVRRSMLTSHITKSCALETFILKDTVINDEDIGDLLSNCPFLESLIIGRCHGLFAVNIDGPSLQLKHLSITGCKQLMEIGIRASELTGFIYEGPAVCLSLIEVPRLVSVEIKVEAHNCYNSVDHVLSMLSRDVPQLQKLIFHIEDENIPEALPTFCTLKHLVLLFGHQSHRLSWVTRLLIVSPFLEKLQLQLPHTYNIDSGKTAFCKTWTHHHLSEVELYGFRGFNKEIKFASNFFYNAKPLQLMQISSQPREWPKGGREKTCRLLRKEAEAGVKLVVL